LKPDARDRFRFLLHQSVMRSSTALRLRGGLTLSRWLQRVVGDYGASIAAEADPDVRVSFGGFDRYWMRVFFRGDFYEPELYRLFKRWKRLPSFDLIDGGANIGFWSAVLTSAQFGVKHAVAVEASPTTYQDLTRTALLCGGRFATEHRALSARTGLVEFEQGVAHASRHIVGIGETASSGNVVTIEATTIDELVAKHRLQNRDLLVKLDVEGAELDCVTGAANAFEAGAIFIYEDHGKEPRSVLTQQLLDRGAACWFITDEGTLERVDAAAEASRFKVDVRRGYNFLCVGRAHAGDLEQRLFG